MAVVTRNFRWDRGIHKLVQYGFLGFYIWVGVRFYQYFSWAMGQSELYVERPVAVEAFLPLGAFISLKKLVLTGEYDLIRPAALTIFILALFLALVLRKSFCGYLCPVGTGMGFVERLGTRLGITKNPPRWLGLLLYVPKYCLLGFFVYIVAQMGIRDIDAFTATQYWRVSDSRMLLFFLHPSVLTLVVVGVIFLGNMLIKGFWCQGFCPYGALLGLISLFSPLAVKRDASQCISCGRCSRVCPSRILVDKKHRVSSTACVGCGECISACPVDGCLSFSAGYGKKTVSLPSWLVPVTTVCAVLLFWVWAVNAGLWYTSIDKKLVRKDHEVVYMLSHY